MIPSWGWVIVIVLGGVLVVVGNIQYARTRQAEQKQILAREARAVLLPEIEKNLELLDKADSLLNQKQIPFETFTTSAWEAVSEGGLLRGMNSAEISQVAGAYQLIYKANEIHERIMELSVGVASALRDAVKHKEHLIQNLKVLLRNLKAALLEIKDANRAVTQDDSGN